MKWCRFETEGRTLSGWLDDASATIRLADSPTVSNASGRVVPLSAAKLLCPIRPTKVIAIGLNYTAHLKEFGDGHRPSEPVIFLKALSAVVGPGEPIVIPQGVGQVDYEAELGIVIGKRCRNVSREEALSVVMGAVCVNDVTARTLQHKDAQWARSKSFDTFAPIGPWVVPGLPFNNLSIESRLSGKVVQKSSTSKMIFPVDYIVSFVSKVMTLEPEDVILTGTPEGIGPMHAGDTIEIVIEGIGTLSNPVVDESH